MKKSHGVEIDEGMDLARMLCRCVRKGRWRVMGVGDETVRRGILLGIVGGWEKVEAGEKQSNTTSSPLELIAPSLSRTLSLTSFSHTLTHTHSHTLSHTLSQLYTFTHPPLPAVTRYIFHS